MRPAWTGIALPSVEKAIRADERRLVKQEAKRWATHRSECRSSPTWYTWHGQPPGPCTCGLDEWLKNETQTKEDQ